MKANNKIPTGGRSSSEVLLTNHSTRTTPGIKSSKPFIGAAFSFPIPGIFYVLYNVQLCTIHFIIVLNAIFYMILLHVVHLANTYVVMYTNVYMSRGKSMYTEYFMGFRTRTFPVFELLSAQHSVCVCSVSRSNIAWYAVKKVAAMSSRLKLHSLHRLLWLCWLLAQLVASSSLFAPRGVSRIVLFLFHCGDSCRLSW